jgi:hypothetical protein
MYVVQKNLRDLFAMPDYQGFSRDSPGHPTEYRIIPACAEKLFPFERLTVARRNFGALSHS